MPTLRRSGGRELTSRPASQTRPLAGVRYPPISRSSVVLPQPDAPSRAKKLPGPTHRLTPWTTGARPNANVTPSSRSAGSAFPQDLAVPEGGDVVPVLGVGVIGVVAERPQLLFGVGVERFPHRVLGGPLAGDAQDGG